jgi:hypothetical protein
MADNTHEWELYEKGKNYKRRIDLYETVDKNERFYSGDQWYGVVSNGLPTPVFNVFKRCINYFISAIMSQKIKMKFTPENIADDSINPEEQAISKVAELISKYSETLWEKLKMDTRMRDALLDSAISGDAEGYVFWNQSIDTGQKVQVPATEEGAEPTVTPIKGDIDFELPDNVNVFFGNPNDYRVETQPYILISFRELVSKLKEEAKKNKVNDEEINRISSDTDYQEQSGDRAKIELDASGEDGKTTTLIKFWKDPDTKTIKYKKSTKAVVIIPEKDMETTRYPLAHMNWDKRKNSYHGQAVGTGLVPNQIYINKMFAMVMLNLMNVAFPKAIYNSTYITKWSNQIGQAIPYDGDLDINKVAGYLQPGNMSNQIMPSIDAAIAYTKDLLGVTDAATGNIKPDNHAAIIAVQQASFQPLETIKANLYQWVEDLGYIWLDMMIAKYGERSITIDVKGKKQVIPFDFSSLKGIKFNLKVDVGPSSYWSEITAMQTLDNLLKDAKIDFIQYLERVPDGMIPKKDDLIEEIKASMANQQPTPPPPPNVSVAFKDIPIAGQIQLAQQMGIELTEQDYEIIKQATAIIEQNQQMQQVLAQAQQQTPPNPLGGVAI